MIEPISQPQRQHVIAVTQACIERAADIYGCDFPGIPVHFDLKGKCSGMYQVRRSGRRIRYNPWLFAKYYQENLNETVPHEVAHYVVDCLYGNRRVKPHGIEWRRVVQALGGKPKATGNYDLEGIPVRRYQTFPYRCGCRVHQLTKIRHGKIQKQRSSYCCQFCGNQLVAL